MGINEFPAHWGHGIAVVFGGCSYDDNRGGFTAVDHCERL